MISGKLPNDTVWWLSTDGLKIWIESKDLEEEKFKEKGFYIAHDNIYRAKKHVGELTTSRLDSRRYKDAWIIRFDAIIDVYPELIEEVNRKQITEKKRRGPYRKKVKRVEFKIETIENKTETVEKDENIVTSNNREPKTDHFDINRPYVIWINDEINKNNGKMRIKLKDLKEKMGNEFINMHDLRIYLGLKKILPNIGISIDIISSKGESIVIMNNA